MLKNDSILLNPYIFQTRKVFSITVAKVLFSAHVVKFHAIVVAFRFYEAIHALLFYLPLIT